LTGGAANLNLMAMTPSRKGSIHLFRVWQVDVYLHWSWFLVAIVQIEYLRDRYTTLVWPVFEYASLFVIVLMHEFGHALACRSVGGKADQIVLWPLGGVAFVDPPQRPGAMLWSIAAGPLVNVALFPLLLVICLTGSSLGWAQDRPDLFQYLVSLCFIDGGLLAFNLLPIYPLDGGQILRSLLWYGVGRARSLMISSTIGFIAVGLLLIFAIRTPWLIIMGAFVLMNCWGGLRQARVLARMEAAPKHLDQACPYCHTPPPAGDFWTCARCRQAFDIYGAHGVCPHCGAQYAQARCAECGQFYDLGH
jgi:Zn-dependent protease